MPTIWYDGLVKKTEPIAPNVKQFWLEMPEVYTFDVKSGQFVTMDVPIGDKRLQRWRS